MRRILGRKRKTAISSKMQIVLTLMIFVIPLMVFLISYNVYMVNIIKNKLAETGKNMIYVYQNPVEKELRNMENAMVDIIANDNDFQQLLYSAKDVDVHIYLSNVLEKLKRALSTNTAAAGCYVYHRKTSFIREAYSGNYSYQNKTDFKAFLRQSIEKDGNIAKKGWILQQIEDKYYLFRVLNRKDTYVITVFDLDKTDKPQFYQENNKDSFLLFTDMQMKALTSGDKIKEHEIELKDSEPDYYITGKQQKYLIVQQTMESVPLHLVYAVPYYAFLVNSDKMPVFFVVASILVMALLLLSFRLLESKYLNPLKQLVNTMETIKNGDMEAKMANGNRIQEFNLLSDTFNGMMDEIKVLKIATYEYRIEMQQAKLQFLQIQIRPHFFLNCLKNLYSLAQEEQYGQIQETILALSDHLRYILKDNLLLVPIKTELQSVENYILLQQMSASYQLSCNIEVDARLNGCEIPPLSVLTFAENSIKHAKFNNKHLMIRIKITILESGNERFIDITILDNGLGFSPEGLRLLNDNTDFEYRDQHVGIQNVKHRFSLIYGDACAFSFFNMTGGGACAEIFIPLGQDEET